MKRLEGPSAALAADIIRCPIVDQCLGAGGESLPCHRVVSWQGKGPALARYVPEPWSGHLTRAPILFVSSNPGADAEGAPLSDASFTSTWSTDEIVSCYDDAFETWRKPGIAEGIYQVDRFGSRADRPVRYWIWVRARARELLQRSPAPGVDYALTEVVHCGTQHEVGVPQAFATCVDRYFERVLEASPAAVIVCVGDWAKEAFKRTLGVDLVDHLWGPAEVAGRRRFVVSVPHPGRFGKPKALEPYVGQERLDQLRVELSQHGTGAGEN
jgi:uracil-DNA glycosylase